MASIVTVFSSSGATAPRSRTTRRAWRYLAAVAFAAGLVVVTPPTTSLAAGTCDPHDRLCGVEAIRESDLSWTSCAQSSVVMLLEALGQVPGESPKTKMQNVAKFVQQGDYTGDDGKFVPLGHSGNTNWDQLLHITDAAASFGIPLASRAWRVSSQGGWLAELRSKVNDSGDLVITLLPSSKALWTNEQVDAGHYLVVSGITDDGQVITHDPIDGQTHIRSAATFQAAWGTSKPWANPYQYLEVVPARASNVPVVSAPPSSQPAAAHTPGGTWISPADGSEQLGTIHASAHAYPSKAGDPAIDHVNFTVWWPALGSKSGPWKTACSVKQPTSGDEYDCDFDPANLGAPAGQLWLSFDVYDSSGASNLSPNGERSVDWAQPDVIVADGWQTFQGDGYTVDYPGPAATVPSQSTGLYTVSASYYLIGSQSDPDVVYLVERITFPSGLLSLYGNDFTPYLKQTLSSYAGYSGGTISSPRDVTVDGHPGLEITSQGTSGAYAVGEIVIVSDDMYMIVAGYYPDRASIDTTTFFASFHLN
jgi:hypothetical protein